jgi:hypothetical protein
MAWASLRKYGLIRHRIESSVNDVRSRPALTMRHREMAVHHTAGGSDTLKVTFTPTDTTDDTTATASVTLQVTPATPTIKWVGSGADHIGHCSYRRSTQRNRHIQRLERRGHILCTHPRRVPCLGTGSQTLSVTFTPNNTANYTGASASVTPTRE